MRGSVSHTVYNTIDERTVFRFTQARKELLHPFYSRTTLILRRVPLQLVIFQVRKSLYHEAGARAVTTQYLNYRRKEEGHT